jgi:hypothetical protein
MDPQFTEWRTSSFCGPPQNDCVEVSLRPTIVGLRDSKKPDAGVLVFDRFAWQAFLTQA